MRFAIAAASGRTTYTAPPIIMNTATASGPLILSAPRQAAGLALFGEPPPQEVHPLGQLRHLPGGLAQLLHLLPQLLDLLGHVVVSNRRLAACNLGRQRLADRGDGEEK